jgi:hypothetical protein
MKRAGQSTMGDVTFFGDHNAFCDWLDVHHTEAREVWVGHFRKSTGRASLTWSASVDAALCFGWIDGIRKSINGDSYKIRSVGRPAFTGTTSGTRSPSFPTLSLVCTVWTNPKGRTAPISSSRSTEAPCPSCVEIFGNRALPASCTRMRILKPGACTPTPLGSLTSAS